MVNAPLSFKEGRLNEATAQSSRGDSLENAPLVATALEPQSEKIKSAPLGANLFAQNKISRDQQYHKDRRNIPVMSPVLFITFCRIFFLAVSLLLSSRLAFPGFFGR